jgi:hypothetical protein
MYTLIVVAVVVVAVAVGSEMFGARDVAPTTRKTSSFVAWVVFNRRRELQWPPEQQDVWLGSMNGVVHPTARLRDAKRAPLGFAHQCVLRNLFGNLWRQYHMSAQVNVSSRGENSANSHATWQPTDTIRKNALTPFSAH